VLSVRWQPRAQFGGASKDFEYLYSNVKLDSIFEEFDSVGSAFGVHGEVPARRKEPKKKLPARVSEEVVEERIGKFEQPPGLAVRRTSGVRSSRSEAERSLMAQQRQEQLKKMNRQALLNQTRFKHETRSSPSFRGGFVGRGGFGGRGGFVGRVKPQSLLVKKELQFAKSRARTREENVSLFKGGASAKRRSGQFQRRGAFSGF